MFISKKQHTGMNIILDTLHIVFTQANKFKDKKYLLCMLSKRGI